jgi:hypothetical protein
MVNSPPQNSCVSEKDLTPRRLRGVREHRIYRFNSGVTATPRIDTTADTADWDR